jgi:type III pantothenate kinase
MTQRVLAIDAGNSRIKWGVHDVTQWLTTSALATADAAELGNAWQELPPLDRVMVANVAGLAVAAALRAALPATPTAHWLISAHEQCGVKNSYQDPTQLGCDRWAALIGAHHLQHGPQIVVDAGTALTADALDSDGTFLGGIIIPGADLMRHALVDQTALLELAEGQFQPLPQTTADAICSGAIQAQAGAVERIAAVLAKRTGCRPHCVLSGGNATQLAPHLNLQLQVVDNLVREGLLVIAVSGAGVCQHSGFCLFSLCR